MSTFIADMSSAFDGPRIVNTRGPSPSTSDAGASGETSQIPPMDHLPQTNDMSVMVQGMKALILQIVGDTCQQIQAKNNNVQAIASPEPAPALIPNNPHIDMRLVGPEDTMKLQQLGTKNILARLHKEGGPWADVVDVQFDLDTGLDQRSDAPPDSADATPSSTHQAQRRVRFVLDTVAGERAARKVMHEASLILGLSPNCGMIPQLYHVRIVGFVRVEGHHTRQYLDMWCRELHRVDVVDHFWTFQKLILSFSNLEHAKKLCRDGVVIREKHFTVQPFDRRAVPMFCFKCFLPGHFKPECKSTVYRCGRCAKQHDIQTCPKKTPKKCVNCSGPHEAWSEVCRFPDTLHWRSKAKAYWIQGPDWSHDPRHFLAPQQATDPAPKAGTGQSSKTPKAASGNSNRNAKKRHREDEIVQDGFVQDNYTKEAASKQAALQVPQPSNLIWAEPNTPATIRF